MHKFFNRILPIVSKGVGWMLGSRNQIRFWLDCWLLDNVISHCRVIPNSHTVVKLPSSFIPNRTVLYIASSAALNESKYGSTLLETNK